MPAAGCRWWARASHPISSALAVALFVLGVFAAIYHPVGTAMLIEQATARGRSLAFNGVCGNLGAALAAGVTAALAAAFGWRAAFLVPARDLHRDRGRLSASGTQGGAQSRRAAARRPMSRSRLWLAATIFGLFIVIALCAGLVFNIISVALPKIVDERLGADVSLLLVGGVATAVFLCGALAQLAVGRLVERFPPHILFAVDREPAVPGRALGGAGERDRCSSWRSPSPWRRSTRRSPSTTWSSRAIPPMPGAAGSTRCAISSPSWCPARRSRRSRFLHGRGGFDLVLGTTAVIALGFVFATAVIAVLVNGVEKERTRAVVPAE